MEEFDYFIKEGPTMPNGLQLHTCCYYSKQIWVNYNGWTDLLDMERIECVQGPIPIVKDIKDCLKCEVFEVVVPEGEDDHSWKEFFGIRDFSDMLVIEDEAARLQDLVNQLRRDMGDEPGPWIDWDPQEQEEEE